MGEKRWPPMWVISQVSVPPGGVQGGGEGAAEERAAAVAPAVGADEDERRRSRGLPGPPRLAGLPRLPGPGGPVAVVRAGAECGVEAGVLAAAEGGEVEVGEARGVADVGGVDPGAAGGGVGGEDAAAGGAADVGVPARPADERHAHAAALGSLLQHAADLGVEVALGQRLAPPRAGLLDEQPGRGDGRGPGERFGQLSGGGRARTHEGEPNRSSTPRPAQPVRPGVPVVSRVPREPPARPGTRESGPNRKQLALLALILRS
ncbi:hypothetical protein GCM10009802_27040 [Streptomyces synnematoformans]|uniref:Uncharacterized protein n=1 Tax=Streptomyces synnematoformans TaxID=415721 RepID=A0ABP5JUF7_9ACTN